MKKIALIALMGAVALAGCQSVSNNLYKHGNFTKLETTEYPIGEGPNFDAQTKADAALVDMQKTQAEGKQRPTAQTADKSAEIQ